MAEPQNVSVIQADTMIEGKIENAGMVELLGTFEGELNAQHVHVRSGARVVGTMNAGTARVDGSVRGTVKVRDLISISQTGEVSGDVEYGQLAVEPGGDLSAEVRNVPPELIGDFAIEVRRGKAVALTHEDLKALDPDNTADELVFTISNLAHGRIARSVQPMQAIQHFSQRDLAQGSIVFVHDGTEQSEAGFDVMVTDAAGATSGRPKRVTVSVQP